MILGVSFIATPVKFHAASLTLPVAVDIGKVTFHLFNFIEWGVFLCIVILISLSGIIRKNLLRITVLLMILTMQTCWLIPILDVRADAIIIGVSEHSSPGYAYWIYVLVECVKVILLVINAKIDAKEAKS